MGRNIKKGLGYFPFDTDFFQDIRIRKLIKYQGGKSVAVYIFLLCTIYREGYYTRWDEELPFVISEQTGYEEAFIREVIICCLNVGLFSKAFFDSDKVLTSKSIQERYKRICQLCRRTCVFSEFSLISSEEKQVNSENKPQRKEKERKGNKTPPDGGVKQAPLAEFRPPSPYSLTLSEEIAQMKSDAIWIEPVCMRYKLTPEDLTGRLDDFFTHCQCIDKRHENISDAKQHFCQWLNIQLKEERNVENRRKSENKRRAVEVSATSPQDYKGTF